MTIDLLHPDIALRLQEVPFVAISDATLPMMRGFAVPGATALRRRGSRRHHHLRRA